MKRLKNRSRQAAMTLVEVLITVLIVTFSGLATLGAMMYGRELRASIEERNAAVREAAGLIESVRATPFTALRSMTLTHVTLDSKGTLEENDDLRGTLVLKLYDPYGNELESTNGSSGGIGSESSVPPPITTGVEARVTVYWSPAGRRSRATQSLTLSTFVAP